MTLIKNKNIPASEVEEGILIACNNLVVDPTTKQLPTEIDALIEGHHGRKQRQDGKIVDVTFTASDIDAAVAHVKSRRERHPDRDFVIDFEHQTLSGNEAPAAGWYSDLYSTIRNGKKVARAIISQWTKKGAEYILNGEYRFSSPVFVQNGEDKETGLTEPLILKNIGLTNEPFIDALLPVAAKAFFNNTTIKGKDTSMDETMSWLRSFLNLPLTATPQDILTELQKLAAQIQSSIGAAAATTAKDLLNYLVGVKTEIAAKASLVKEICGKDTGTIEEARATYVTSKSAMTELVAAKAQIITLTTEKQTREFDVVIAKAFGDGKILPVQKNDAAWLETQKMFAMKDMTSFTAFWDKQPKIAPTGALPQVDSAIAAKDISPEAIEIGKQMGLDRATIEKFGM